MFGQKKDNDAPPPLLENEGRLIASLNKEAYFWLGQRYEWYNKIRNAKKGGFLSFSDASLESQMEATRSALNLVMKTLNTGLGLAFNSVVDGVTNSGTAPEGWPEKVAGDRSDPRPLTNEQDAIILAWMPLKFFNLSKSIRDKGKGLDFYTDGLIKKLYFKVIGFYADPRNWDTERLGYMLSGLEPDAGLQEVQGRLGTLKGDADILAASLIPFKFGKSSRRKEAGQKNTIEDTFNISDEELVHDLYFQALLLAGMENFLFRYYLTLLGATENPRAMNQITIIFQPILAKVVELHIRFQSSFATERDKVRLRKEYMEFFKKREALPPVETVEVKGKQTRRFHYNNRLLERGSFSRAPKFSERQAQIWAGWLKPMLTKAPDKPSTYARIFQLLGTLVFDTQCSMEGKVIAAGDLRAFADEQEKLGKIQLNNKKKAIDTEKRDKAKRMGKFKALEQMSMVETIKTELEQFEAKAAAELEQFEAAVAKRREVMITRVGQLEVAARKDREENQGKNAAAVYHLVSLLDEEKRFRGGLVSNLVHHIQEDKDDLMNTMYKNLFGVVTDFFPTEKMMLRMAISQKITLEEGDLSVSEEEMESYRQQILTRKQDVNIENPGILDQKLSQGPVPVKVDDLLNMGLTASSLRLLFQLPFNAPNKPAAKISGEAVKKLLMINQLAHPLPDKDIILPNVEESAPAMKKVNFNRLQKLVSP